MKSIDISYMTEQGVYRVGDEDFSKEQVLEAAKQTGPGGYFRLGKARVSMSVLTQMAAGQMGGMTMPLWRDDQFASENESDEHAGLLAAGATIRGLHSGVVRSRGRFLSELAV